MSAKVKRGDAFESKRLDGLGQPKKCRVAGCRLDVIARALCAAHYWQALTWIRADRKRRSWSSPELTARLAGGPLA